MNQQENVFVDLLVSMLAVNSWPIDRVGQMLPALEREGLTSYERLASMEFGEISSALLGAGYNRGDYMVSLLTDRLFQASRRFRDEGLQSKLLNLEAERNISEIRVKLRTLHGVGPRVIESYLLLRGLTKTYG